MTPTTLPDSYSHTLACALVERELITCHYRTKEKKGKREVDVWRSYQMVVSRVG